MKCMLVIFDIFAYRHGNMKVTLPYLDSFGEIISGNVPVSPRN